MSGHRLLPSKDCLIISLILIHLIIIINHLFLNYQFLNIIMYDINVMCIM